MTLATLNTEQAERTATESAKAVGEQVRSGTEEVYSSAKEQAEEVYSSVKTQAEEAYTAAKAKAEQVASQRRDNVADYVHDISDAVGSASHVLEERGRATAAHLARRVAEQIGSAGERVRGQDVSQVLTKVEEFARDRPVLVFACAFLASFAVIRMIGRGDAHHAEGYAI